MAKKTDTETNTDEGYNEDTDYQDIRKHALDSYEEPDNVPNGIWAIRTIAFKSKEGEDDDGGEYTNYSFTYEPFEPTDDVDPEAVERGDWKGKLLSANMRVYWNDPSRVRRDAAALRRRVEAHGILIQGRTIDEIVESKALTGVVVLATVGTRSYKTRDGEERTDNSLSGFAPYEG